MGRAPAPSRTDSRRPSAGGQADTAGDAEDGPGGDYQSLPAHAARGYPADGAHQPTAPAGPSSGRVKRYGRAARGCHSRSRSRQAQAGSYDDSPAESGGSAGIPGGSQDSPAGAAGRATKRNAPAPSPSE